MTLLRSFFREPRPDGFGGKLRFDDLEKLFLMLHVQPTDAERDDLWAEMIFSVQQRKPCAWIDDIALIEHSLVTSGVMGVSATSSAGASTTCS